MAWGFHLLVDAAGCNDEINKPDTVKKFLIELVGKLAMSPIGGPNVVYVDWDEGRGVSGVQLITTSTITFHGDDEGNCFYLDVFSCKKYNEDVVLDLVEEYFGPESVKKQMVERNA